MEDRNFDLEIGIEVFLKNINYSKLLFSDFSFKNNIKMPQNDIIMKVSLSNNNKIPNFKKMSFREIEDMDEVRKEMRKILLESKKKLNYLSHIINFNQEYQNISISFFLHMVLLVLYIVKHKQKTIKVYSLHFFVVLIQTNEKNN